VRQSFAVVVAALKKGAPEYRDSANKLFKKKPLRSCLSLSPIEAYFLTGDAKTAAEKRFEQRASFVRSLEHGMPHLFASSIKKPQEPHLVQFAAVLHKFITFLGLEPMGDEEALEVSEGLDSADFGDIVKHVLIVQKRLGHIAMVCLEARVSKYADLFSEVLVPCLRARDSDDPAEKKVTWSPTGLVNVEEETCREDEIALQALITHYMEAMLLDGAPLKLVSDTRLKIPEGKIMYPLLALLPTLGNLAIHGKRYVDLASRHVEDFNDFVVLAENFKLYVAAMSRAKGAIEKIEDGAAQHVIQVLCSTLTCGMQSLVEKVLKQLSDTFDKLRLSLDSEDLDLDKALEANMSETKLCKMFKSSAKKEFKNL
jgi:hypothetical protein